VAKRAKNEVFEVKKAEVREGRLIREEEFDDPLAAFIDDVGAAPAKDDGMIEEVEEVEKVEDPEVPKAPEAPAKPMPRTLMGDLPAGLVEELTQVLRVPKTKDSIMVFSMYSVGEYDRRYFLLDVDGIAYRRAWSIFKERTGTADQVKFLELVYQILSTDLPRLHRAVDWVPLI